ncbi:hypothetical protein ACTPEM_26125, partial [Clostridioides difficile]
AAMLTVTMIAGSSTAGIASAQTVATNLTGQERYETAVKISQDPALAKFNGCLVILLVAKSSIKLFISS